MNSPRVTVVVPTHNRLPYLQEAVESVRRQTFADWEVIVVDDASDDGTWEWLSRQKDPRVKPTRLASHSERSAARNRGLNEANAGLILFLDDDDRLVPTALARLTRALHRQPRAVAAVGARVVFSQDGHRRRAGGHPRIWMTLNVWSAAMTGWVANQGMSLIRLEPLRSAGAWNQAYIGSEDQELWLRLTRLGPVAFVPWTVVENRMHKDQWRGLDEDKVAEEIRNEHLLSLGGEERVRAELLLKIWKMIRESQRCFMESQPILSLRLIRDVLTLEPRLAISPIIGPPLATFALRCLAAAVSGPHVWERIRTGKNFARKAMRRSPGGTLKPERRGSARWAEVSKGPEE